MRKVSGFSVFTICVCSLAVLFVYRLNSIVLLIYNKAGGEIPNRISHLIEFGMFYAGFVWLLVSIFVLMKDFYFRKIFSILINVLVLIFWVLLLVCYMGYIDLFHIPYSE
jgi:hypothetical protein